MFLCFYSLLMRQERGVSGCVHWCDEPGVRWMRVNACADALSHLPITGTRRVITESWPWRSGPRQGACIHGALKAAIQRRSGTPNSYPVPPPAPSLSASLCAPQTLAHPLAASSQRHGPQTLCCQGWCGRQGQRCLLEVRLRQWAHLMGPSGRVTWHN